MLVVAGRAAGFVFLGVVFFCCCEFSGCCWACMQRVLFSRASFFVFFLLLFSLRSRVFLSKRLALLRTVCMYNMYIIRVLFGLMFSLLYAHNLADATKNFGEGTEARTVLLCLWGLKSCCCGVKSHFYYCVCW